MGHVLSALHLELEQRVAIKLLLPGKAPTKTRHQRLLRKRAFGVASRASMSSGCSTW